MNRKHIFILKFIILCCAYFYMEISMAKMLEKPEKKEQVMISIRKANERGLSQNSWLKSFHTFSFSDYYDPKFMGFRTLRVINEDTVQAGKGFDSHPHKDMEIITYVINGSLEHQDSMGNKTIINPGEVQRMSAGAGVIHSEYNNENDTHTHFYQIWITPKIKGGVPSYDQKSFAEALNKKNMVLVGSENGREGSIPIKQDANIYLAKISRGEVLDYQQKDKRHLWVQIIKGKIKVGDYELSASDAFSSNASNDSSLLKIQAEDEAELMIFDLG